MLPPCVTHLELTENRLQSIIIDQPHPSLQFLYLDGNGYTENQIDISGAVNLKFLHLPNLEDFTRILIPRSIRSLALPRQSCDILTLSSALGSLPKLEIIKFIRGQWFFDLPEREAEAFFRSLPLSCSHLMDTSGNYHCLRKYRMKKMD